MPSSSVPDALSALAGDLHSVQFEFAAIDGQPEWAVRTMSLHEGISAPYSLELELGTDDPHGDPAAMLGKSATLSWGRQRERFLHGVVVTVRDGDSTAATTIVHVSVVPALAALGHVSNTRIFADTSIADLVQGLLTEALQPLERESALDLAQTEYPTREYTVQHRETDLAFVDRLLAEQGLWYYFEQPAGDDAREKLIVTDSPGKAPPIADDPELELLRERALSSSQEAILGFGRAKALGTNRVRVRQYNWTHPEVVEDVEKRVSPEAPPALAAYEHGDVAGYDYKAPSYQKYDTEAQAQLRLDRYQSDLHVYRGQSNAASLRAGCFMRVEGKEYLITRVTHTGHAVFNTGQSRQRGEYSNVFECVTRELSYRPPPPKKPRIVGIQTATVVGRTGRIEAPESSADGEDVVTDEHGRVRVKFSWDMTEAGPTGTNSCWVRVAQAVAGMGWGMQFIPRVGMEVVVQFIDGDPDRPLVTGCVYNGLNPPPYKDKPTQSGLKTASSVDRSRYNEWRFEDAKDQEQIFVRAQKDYVEDVLHDHTTTVHHDQTQSITGSQSESVGGSQSLTVSGKRTKSVGGDKEAGEQITIKGERSTTVTKKHSETFQDAHEVTVTKAVTETYQDTQDRTVTGIQKFEAKSDKLEHVVGSYELTTDKAFVLNQGATKLTYEGEKVALDAANSISVKRGTASIDVDTGGNIAVKTTGAITLEVGANKIAISSSGIELNGLQISAKAGPSQLALTPASAGLSSVNTTVEATAICSIKGTATLALN